MAETGTAIKERNRGSDGGWWWFAHPLVCGLPATQNTRAGGVGGGLMAVTDADSVLVRRRRRLLLLLLLLVRM